MIRSRFCPRTTWTQQYIKLATQQSCRYSSQDAAVESVHSVSRDETQFDQYLDDLCRGVLRAGKQTSLHDLHEQFLNEAGTVLSRNVPYEERPSASRRADKKPEDERAFGDGLVLVVHALLRDQNELALKTTVCSGFVVDASIQRPDQGDIVITCAHTLNEINKYMQEDQKENRAKSFSFIVTSLGQIRVVTRLLSSMPRSDAIALEVKPLSVSDRLRSLPLSPYPVYTGTPVLTHLFDSFGPPGIQQSIARTKASAEHLKREDVEQPRKWLADRAYRRWGLGLMLGYRSYTGVEIEAGISSILPHMLTSVLPTPGSSGGPIVNADTGSVVGLISGRRMDNRVEGERGWGCSAESIFEMFSLPGFTPTTASKHAYP